MVIASLKNAVSIPTFEIEVGKRHTQIWIDRGVGLIVGVFIVGLSVWQSLANGSCFWLRYLYTPYKVVRVFALINRLSYCTLPGNSLMTSATLW